MYETYPPQASPAKKHPSFEKIMFIPFAACALLWLLNQIVYIIELVHYAKKEYASYDSYYYYRSEQDIFLDYLRSALPSLFEAFVCVVIFGILTFLALRRYRGIAYPILYGVLALVGLVEVILNLVQVINYSHWYNVVRLLISLLLLVGYIGAFVFSLLLLRKNAVGQGRETVRKLSVLPPILIAGGWALYMLFRIVALIQWHDDMDFFRIYYFLVYDLPVLLTAAGVFLVGKWLSQAAPAASASVPQQYARPTYVPPQYVPTQPVPTQYVPPQYVPTQPVPPQYVQPQYVPPQYVPPQYVPTQPVPPQYVPTQPMPVSPAQPPYAQSFYTHPQTIPLDPAQQGEEPSAQPLQPEEEPSAQSPQP